MKEMKVKKNELITVLKKNRSSHRKEFLKAIEGYREEAIRQLDLALTDAKGGRKINLFFRLIQPTDQTKDYDRVIGMLEMCVEDEINISEQEYQQYVQDDWSWKDQFTTTNAMYVSS